MAAEFEPLVYDPRGVFLPAHGLTREELAELAPALESARREVLAETQLWESGGDVPAEKEPLDAGFVGLPERLLAEHAHDAGNSEIGRIQAAARRIRAVADRVVVLGIGGSYMGARALLEACCHPYHNQLSRPQRAALVHDGGPPPPQMFFEGNNVDNDAAAGLLELLEQSADDAGDEDGWGLVVISKSGGTLETAAALRLFLPRLEAACAGRPELLARRFLPVTGRTGKLRNLVGRLQEEHGTQFSTFDVPEGVGGRFSVLSAVGLLPAAILGLDVVALLEGAAAMNARFREAPAYAGGEPFENPVLDYVGVCHLLEKLRGQHIRVLSAWSKGLEAAGLWHDQLLSESLGKEERGATPLTAVNTRDLHSRGQQHQEGRRDKLITNVVVERTRTAPLPLPHSSRDEDNLNRFAGKTLSDLMAAAVRGTNEAYREACRPTADLRLPRSDEASLGQFFQMLMLATVVEGRLVGTNPYGQPGVEFYKRNMNQILEGDAS